MLTIIHCTCDELSYLKQFATLIAYHRLNKPTIGILILVVLITDLTVPYSLVNKSTYLTKTFVTQILRVNTFL